MAAILVDGATTSWTPLEDGYGMRTESPLAAGLHSFEIPAGAAIDLAGRGLDTPFVQSFEKSQLKADGPASMVFRRPDPRRVPIETLVNRFGFHGRPVDVARGLVYFRNRWFSPRIGRFLTADPLGHVDGPSEYQFAGHSPMNYTDEMGLCVGPLKRTSFCRAVNRGVSWLLVGTPDGAAPVDQLVMNRYRLARRDAIRLNSGLAVSPRVTQRLYPNLHHGSMPDVVGLIVHQTGAETASSTFNYYVTSRIGAHFLIDRDGTIYQTALLNERAAHVGPIKSRCLQELTYCAPPAGGNLTTADLVEYRRTGQQSSLSNYEAGKSYPYRYPMNADSIGIELVGAARDPKTGHAPLWSHTAVYDDATVAQNLALTWLVRQLSRLKGTTEDDVFRHPLVRASKNPTEARSLNWRMPWDRTRVLLLSD